jgi:hypothetical protein
MRLQISLYRLLPLSLLLLNSLLGSTVAAELAVRGACCPGGTVDDDGNCATNPNDIVDEATDDGSPGIGFEFECGQILLQPEKYGCTEEQMEKAKGNILGGRTGTNWELTADTTVDQSVDAEYILNGKTIKLGSGDLQKAAEEVANDVVSYFLRMKQSSSNVKIDSLEPLRRDGPELLRD